MKECVQELGEIVLGIIVRIALYNFLILEWRKTPQLVRGEERREKLGPMRFPLIIQGKTPPQRRDCNSLIFYYPTSCTCSMSKVGSSSDILQTIAIAVVQFFGSIGSRWRTNIERSRDRLVGELATVPSQVSASVKIGEPLNFWELKRIETKLLFFFR